MGQNPDFGSRYGNDYHNVPNPVWLERPEQEYSFESVWWPRLFEDPNATFNIENIAASASKHSTTSLSTTFDMTIFPGWKGNFRPRTQISQQRTMSQPEQATEQNQWSLGTAADFNDPAIPFSAWYNPQQLRLNYDFQNSDNYDSTGMHSLNSLSHDIRVSLSRKTVEKVPISLDYHVHLGTDTNYVGALGTAQAANKSLHEPSIQINYYINVDKVMKLWDIWPFNGRELKIKQAFKLDNSLTASLSSQQQPQLIGSNTALSSQIYTLLDQVTYNILENVQGNISLENKLSYFQGGAPRDSYSLRLTLGLAATF
jgi:hypothetical protein